MELLESLTVQRADGDSQIRLYQGDLSAIPEEESVDLLVVSAFPDNYDPVPNTLIGALEQRGLSVADLAQHKAEDLRATFGCWLTGPLPPDVVTRFHFQRLLCFEPLLRGSPPEVVGDIFRCLMPFAWGVPPIRSVALPLVASGNARVPASAIFEPLVRAAMLWLQRGLPLETIKIVERNPAKAEDLRRRFAAIKAGAQAANVTTPVSRPLLYDVFISYSRKDGPSATAFADQLRRQLPQFRIFVDTLEIKPGDSWQDEMDRAIVSSARIVPLYSPHYIASRVCQEEFNMARARHRKLGNVLFPIYLHSTELLPYMEIIDYVDCREGDAGKLSTAAEQLIAWHRARAGQSGEA